MCAGCWSRRRWRSSCRARSCTAACGRGRWDLGPEGPSAACPAPGSHTPLPTGLLLLQGQVPPLLLACSLPLLQAVSATPCHAMPGARRVVGGCPQWPPSPASLSVPRSVCTSCSLKVSGHLLPVPLYPCPVPAPSLPCPHPALTPAHPADEDAFQEVGSHPRLRAGLREPPGLTAGQSPATAEERDLPVSPAALSLPPHSSCSSFSLGRG